ncbi:MAG TPA: hypothetical protein VMP67_06090 [Candidatus Limnocylindria bacterium]|nr:hypothetical protein [Candidatus Limnocylindria bacterium]
MAITIQPDEGVPAAADRPAGECLEFVRFCYRRRRVTWPSLYDEMAAVAARGTFRGLGFAELAERGICFSLPDLPRLAALTEQVMLEERNTAEPRVERRDEPSDERAGRLSLIPARG